MRIDLDVRSREGLIEALRREQGIVRNLITIKAEQRINKKYSLNTFLDIVLRTPLMQMHTLELIHEDLNDIGLERVVDPKYVFQANRNRYPDYIGQRSFRIGGSMSEVYLIAQYFNDHIDFNIGKLLSAQEARSESAARAFLQSVGIKTPKKVYSLDRTASMQRYKDRVSQSTDSNQRFDMLDQTALLNEGNSAFLLYDLNKSKTLAERMHSKKDQTLLRMNETLIRMHSGATDSSGKMSYEARELCKINTFLGTVEMDSLSKYQYQYRINLCELLLQLGERRSCQSTTLQTEKELDITRLLDNQILLDISNDNYSSLLSDSEIRAMRMAQASGVTLPDTVLRKFSRPSRKSGQHTQASNTEEDYCHAMIDDVFNFKNSIHKDHTEIAQYVRDMYILLDKPAKRMDEFMSMSYTSKSGAEMPLFAGIVHDDCHPENWLVTEGQDDYELTLIDISGMRPGLGTDDLIAMHYSRIGRKILTDDDRKRYLNDYIVKAFNKHAAMNSGTSVLKVNEINSEIERAVFGKEVNFADSHREMYALSGIMRSIRTIMFDITRKKSSDNEREGAKVRIETYWNLMQGFMKQYSKDFGNLTYHHQENFDCIKERMFHINDVLYHTA